MTKYNLYLLLLLTILLSFQCRKAKSESEELPPATQTGAKTFGCLVNGKIFTPKGSTFGGPVLSASYQYLDDIYSKGYFFSVNAKNTTSDGLTGIYINTDSLTIQQGQTIVLETFGKKGAASGGYYIGLITRSDEYLTNSSSTGELHISKLDESKRIVSGTFWFDGVNGNGEKVEVREGRFDLHYTF